VGPIPSIGEDAHVARKLQGVGTRIVGGVPTGVQEFEWLVSLRDTRFGQEGFCGGTLLSANWVLTAAHCVIDYNKANKRKKLRVAIGRHKTNGNSHPNNKHPIQDLSVEAVHMHQSYNDYTLKNDIALLKLSSPAMDYWEAVDSFGMPAADIGGETLTVAGWGTLSSGGNTPSVAQKVEVEGSSCSAYGNSIKDGMICAAENGKDSCQGDSGGPLVYKNGADDFTLVGVVSWGEGCAGSKPGVYTDVDYFRSWICETMEENTGSGDDPLHQSCGDSTPSPSPSPSPPPTQIQLPPVAEFEGVFLSSTDQKWYAVAAGSKSSGFTTASSALLWLPSLCADSHDRCPMKLNTAAKRAKNCPKANGWNSQKCAATCGPELGGCSPG